MLKTHSTASSGVSSLARYMGSTVLVAGAARAEDRGSEEKSGFPLYCTVSAACCPIVVPLALASMSGWRNAFVSTTNPWI